MKPQVSLSHVAVLVPSVRKAADFLRQLEFQIGEEEVFEETREIYVQGHERNPLLLMEALDKGSYRQALNKRGPGIHHLAIDVLDIEKFLDSISTSGWLLHLNSLNALKNYRTAYLARPGFPALIEVQEKKQLMEGPLFVEEVSLKLNADHSKLAEAVGLDRLLKSSTEKPRLTLRGTPVNLEKLF